MGRESATREASTVSKGKRDARDQARAMMAAQRRADARRKKMLFASIAVGIVLLAVVIVVIAKVTSKPAVDTTTASTAPTALVNKVTKMPAATLDKIGKGSVTTPPTAISGQPVLKASDGKPQVFYMGAEYCPYCAAERWAMIVALSRFGTFHNLSLTSSTPTDVDPNTPSFSFHGATYSSPYLSFTAKELQSNVQLDNGQYQTLDTLTDAETALVKQYNPNQSYPFVDFGNQASIVGASYDPGVLANMTQDQVADALKDPTSKVAQAIGGTANAITAQLCKLTDNQPANVCNSTAAKAFSNG
jgi:thiol-disulfide isomerase/thioredoxin